MRILKAAFSLVKDSVTTFLSDRATIFAAGLAYYAIFALAPLIIVTIAIAGFFIGRSNAGSQLTAQIQFLVGEELTAYLGDLVRALADRTVSRTATILSILALFISASAIFNQLKTALNKLWGITSVRPKNRGEWLWLVRYRAIPFLMVFFFGVLLSVSVMLDTIVGIAGSRLALIAPGLAALLPNINRLFVPALTFATFTIILKALPDAFVRWRDIGVGAALTTMLFLVGRWFLAYFLALSNTSSVYGAAGSFVVLLIWFYYSAIILLFGAVFTKLYADRHGRPIRPNRLAMLGEPSADQ